MTPSKETLDSDARGETSREGIEEHDDPKAPKLFPGQPRLTPPAEGDSGPSTDDGLGEKTDIEPDPNRPVPTGDPRTESERIDLQ